MSAFEVLGTSCETGSKRIGAEWPDLDIKAESVTGGTICMQFMLAGASVES